jgi:hypothetical protein
MDVYETGRMSFVALILPFLDSTLLCGAILVLLGVVTIYALNDAALLIMNM